MAEEARTTLKSHVRSAATYWVKAAAVAAKRGDHRPARDLLLHAGVITRLGDTVGPQMQVVIGMPGHPAIEPPSQEAIDAAIAREEAAWDTIDMVRVPPRELGMPSKRHIRQHSPDPALLAAVTGTWPGWGVGIVGAWLWGGRGVTATCRLARAR